MKDFLEIAIREDQNDPLAKFKNRFLSDKKLIYLDGNSLGKLPKAAIEILSKQVEKQWGQRLIRAWNEEWIELPSRLATKIAKIVGASPDEIFVGDSTSINLYKLAFAAISYNKKRWNIVTDDLNFPTDHYILQGMIAHHFPDHKLVIAKSYDSISMKESDLTSLLNEDTALVSLSHVCYKSAFMYDMNKINEAIKKSGALLIWDLSHSVGSVPINLNESNTDMAVGCTYKYLNGGPGAPAFLYVRKDLQEKLSNPIWGWFSHKNAFDFDLDYEPQSGIKKFAGSTPNILSLAAMEAGLDLILEAGMKNLRKKSIRQIDYILSLYKKILKPLGFELASPIDFNERGSHISFRHDSAYQINRAMIEPLDSNKIAVIPDFRPPDIIRLGLAPIYTTYLDLYNATCRIRDIVESKEYEKRNFGRMEVT